jgi:hypothetical protein
MVNLPDTCTDFKLSYIQNKLVVCVYKGQESKGHIVF